MWKIKLMLVKTDGVSSIHHKLPSSYNFHLYTIWKNNKQTKNVFNRCSTICRRAAIAVRRSAACGTVHQIVSITLNAAPQRVLKASVSSIVRRTMAYRQTISTIYFALNRLMKYATAFTIISTRIRIYTANNRRRAKYYSNVPRVRFLLLLNNSENEAMVWKRYFITN